MAHLDESPTIGMSDWPSDGQDAAILINNSTWAMAHLAQVDRDREVIALYVAGSAVGRMDSAADLHWHTRHGVGRLAGFARFAQVVEGCDLWYLQVTEGPRIVNRRRHARHRVTLDASLTYYDRAVLARTVDISYGGARMNVADPVSLEAMAPVEVDLAVNGAVCAIHGTVAWVSPGAIDIGIEFAPLDRGHKRHLRDAFERAMSELSADCGQLPNWWSRSA